MASCVKKHSSWHLVVATVNVGSTQSYMRSYEVDTMNADEVDWTRESLVIHVRKLAFRMRRRWVPSYAKGASLVC